MGFDRYNQCSTGDKCETLRTPGGGDNFPTVCYGVEEKTPIIDSVGGQSESAWEGKAAPCLKATHYKMPPCVAVAFEPGAARRIGGYAWENVAGTLRAEMGDNQTAVAYAVENHPADSRVNLDEDGKVQTLTSRMGTGGGNVPMVMEPKAYEWHNQDSRITGPIDTAYTLNTNAGGREGHLVVEPKPVICLQGNGIDRADTAGCNGKGWKEDTAYTLNTIDRPAVAYSFDSLASNSMKSKNPHSGCREVEVAKTLDTTDPNPSKNQGGIAVVQPIAYGLDRASFNQGQNAKFDFQVTEENQPTLTARGPGAVAQPIFNASKASFFMKATENGPADTLVATDYKDPQLVAYQDKVGSLCASDHKGIRNQDIDENKAIVQEMPRGSTHYIVRRLTPTECARLQGFADQWGVVDTKTFLTDVEFKFWTDVRNTHAAINGKKVQEYTRKQMLAWYNKLWTDSAEYKMWGNGIALPTALYTIQGIADALDAAEMIADELNGATEAIEDWML